MKTLNLPNEVSDLVKAQVSHNSTAFANCFSETAIVFDEDKTHKGKVEIQHWIDKANKRFSTMMKPLEYTHREPAGILLAEVSGTFEESPLIMNFIFVFRDEKIQSLKIIR
ncbi:nuclear transport factor 2 family protein [Cesiribacter sp. SM1]|uniref:nuclear transport factor 2 family protein n=1 Tax=Cesiribacter sp. SM1 TaxID=2861196 RepID=UPI001CD2B38D|nr:nuclear transport factor 2 family protein [Cesiribacter sp. SM1]